MSIASRGDFKENGFFFVNLKHFFFIYKITLLTKFRNVDNNIYLSPKINYTKHESHIAKKETFSLYIN